MSAGLGASLKRIGAITLFVEDLARTRTFYRNVFGLDLVFEDENSAAFDLGGTIVNLLAVSEAPGLIAPGTVAGPDVGARSQLTIDVDDVDAVCAELDSRGVVLLNGPLDRPWGVRTACFADPAGHLWELAQALPQESSTTP